MYNLHILNVEINVADYLSINPNAGDGENTNEYLSTDPTAGDPIEEPKIEAPQEASFSDKAKQFAIKAGHDVVRDTADSGVALAKGVVSVPQSFVGIADLVSGGKAGKAVESAGVRFKDTQNILDSLFSQEQKDANAAVQSADGFVDTLGAIKDNPRTAITTAIESAPLMGAGGAISRAGMAALPAKVAEKTGAAIAAGATGESFISAGSSAEDVRSESPNGELTGSQSLKLAGSGLTTGLVGAASGRLASKFGFGDIETMIARGGPTAVTANAAKQSFKKQLIYSGFSEGVLEETPQSSLEQMWKNWAQGKPIMDGVGNAAATGLVTGTGMGLAGGAFNGTAQPRSNAPGQEQPLPQDDINFINQNVDAQAQPEQPAETAAQPFTDQEQVLTRIAELELTGEQRDLTPAEKQEYGSLSQSVHHEEQPKADSMDNVVSSIIGSESGGKANAKNKRSTASGAGQFLDKTWLDVLKRNRPDLASGKSNDELLALKTDPELSREMTKRYAEENASELQRSGIEPNASTIYLAHHFGIGGAKKLLSADKNKSVSDVMDAGVINANPYMRGKTVGEVIDWVANRVGSRNNEEVQNANTNSGKLNQDSEAPAIDDTAASGEDPGIGDSTIDESGGVVDAGISGNDSGLSDGTEQPNNIDDRGTLTPDATTEQPINTGIGQPDQSGNDTAIQPDSGSAAELNATLPGEKPTTSVDLQTQQLINLPEPEQQLVNKIDARIEAINNEIPNRSGPVQSSLQRESEKLQAKRDQILPPTNQDQAIDQTQASETQPVLPNTGANSEGITAASGNGADNTGVSGAENVTSAPKAEDYKTPADYRLAKLEYDNQQASKKPEPVKKKSFSGEPTGLEELQTAIRKIGGIKRGGHSDRSGFTDFKGRRYTGIFNNGKNAKTFDEMAEHLRQYGYQIDGENDLIEKLYDSLNGNHHYSPAGSEVQSAAMQQAHNDAMQEQDRIENEIDSKEEREAIQQAESEWSKLDDYDFDGVFNNLLSNSNGKELTADEFDELLGFKPSNAEGAQSTNESQSREPASSNSNGSGKTGKVQTNATGTGRKAESGVQKSSQGDESTDLTGYTQKELESAAAKKAQDEKSQAEKDRKAAQKAQADKDIDSFADDMLGLTPKTADVFGMNSPMDKVDDGASKSVKTNNTAFTDDAAEKARALLKSKIGQLNSGLDPEVFAAGVTLAGWHIEKGARSFADYAKAMIEDMGEAFKPYLKQWYLGVKFDPRASNIDGMDSAASVEAADINNLETNNVPGTDTNLEPDSTNAGNENAGNEKPVQSGRAVNGRSAGKTSSTVAGEGNGSRSYSSNSIDPASIGGERGGKQVHPTDQPTVSTELPAGVDDSERGGNDSNAGIQADIAPEPKIKALVEQGNKATTASKEVKLADPDNIAATLPILNDGQKADVLFAERRIENHPGVLFTNGTGTGKTFTALGVIKRHELQGKKNIIVVVPSQNIMDQWIKASGLFDMSMAALKNTKDSGSGIVITTYANFGENDALVSRDWDLVVTDESHKLMQSEDGKPTAALYKLRGLTYHRNGFNNWFDSKHADIVEARNQARISYQATRGNDVRIEIRSAADAEYEKQDKIYHETRKAAQEEYNNLRKTKTPKVTFLSATPFAYVKTVDYAEGYLFDYGTDKSGSAYNSGNNYDNFFVSNFGYRMRYNKLTQPDANVDQGIMARQFNTQLRKSGALSFRGLDVNFDYDRKFILTESAIGQSIDRAMEWIRTNQYKELSELLDDKFDYLQRRYMLESIKAKESIHIVRDHLALGRKVIVFHDYKKGGATNPFKFFRGMNSELNNQIDEFDAKFPELASAFDKLPHPIDMYTKEFGDDVMIYNGSVSGKDRIKLVGKFNDDNSGKNLILVQSASAKEGVSFHDTTGKHQRVLINLGLPTQPTTAIQQEGRIYRVGQASDAIMRYMNTGTNWERWAFASTIAQRASTAENLAVGEGARALKDAFINAFEESDTYAPGHENEGKGGKEADRSTIAAISEFDRAKTLYYGQGKKTSRNKSAEGNDYYATPEPIGLMMTRFADARPGNAMLEPSGGHGAIARWFRDDAIKTAIEPSGELSSRLALVFDGDIKRQNFEDLSIVNKYDAIVMNPPFGKGSGGKLAIEHLDKAFKHLRNNGRIVAVLPRGGMAEKRFDAWMHFDIAKTNTHLIADILMPSSMFERAGTAVNTRVVVIDRIDDPELYRNIQTSNIDLSNSTNINDLFDRIENLTVRDRQVKEEEIVVPVPATRRGQTAVANEAAKEAEKKAVESGVIAQSPDKATFELVGKKIVTNAPAVQITTRKGKVLDGVFVQDEKMAKAADEFTYQPNGRGNGWFVRLRNIERPLASKSAPAPGNTHTKQSLAAAVTSALDNKFGTGWTDKLFATGKFKVIDSTEAASLVGKDALFHKVWHGTPHDFDQFSLDNIGTGEGAAAFGHGLYFTDSRDIANYYSGNEGIGGASVPTFYIVNGKKTQTGTPEQKAADLIYSTSIAKAKSLAKSMLSDAINGYEWTKEKGLDYYQKIFDTVNSIKSKSEIKKSKGNVYQVELAPNQDEYLDWDKPISDQSKLIKEAFKNSGLIKEYNANLSDFATPMLTRGRDKRGKNFHAYLEHKLGSSKAVSDYLHGLGIRGIRYKADDGKSNDKNYVIFNDADASIQAKFSKDVKAKAFYNPGDKTTYLIADHINEGDNLVGLMTHEISVHALNLGKSAPEFKFILKQLESQRGSNKKIRDAFARVPKNTAPENVTEEALGYFVENNKSHPLIGKITAWFKAALKRLGIGGQWVNSLSNSEILNMATEALRTAPENIGNATGSDSVMFNSDKMPETINVNGKERSTFNSNGQLIHQSEEGIKNFWRWFGDSKVVDDQGRPLVVYHGGKGGIDSFDPNRAGSIEKSDWGKGIYFTPSKNSAELYMEGYNKAVDKKSNELWDEMEAKAKEFGTGIMDVSIDLGKKKITQDQYDQLKELENRWRQSRTEAAKNGSGDVYQTYLKIEKPHYSTFEGVTDPFMAEYAKSKGNDGIIIEYSSGGFDELVAFDPNQIKSATGNTGEFSATNNNIMFSIGPVERAKSKIAEMLSRENIDKFIYEAQDKYIDLKRLRNRIQDINGAISDLSDAYMGEELYHGRVAKRTKDFLNNEVKPLLAGLRAANITVDDFEKYLHALHAPEANAEMAKRNPSQQEIIDNHQRALDEVRELQRKLMAAQSSNGAQLPIKQALEIAQEELDRWNNVTPFKGTEEERLSLSGMSDAEAQSVIDSLPSGQRTQYEQLGNKVREINANTLEMLEKYGLMSKDSLNNWRNAYKNYIPLHRDEAHADSTSHPIGQGFSTRGDASKRRVGSNEKVTHILGHLAMQRESAITRGEKNNVMKRLYLMARQNPFPDIWKTDQVPTIRTVGKDGFVRSVPDPMYKQHDNILMLRIAGKDTAIVFNEHNKEAMRMASALKNMDIGDIGIVASVLGKATRWFSSVNTQYNPVFGVINLTRDVQGAALNLSATELAGKQAEVMKDTLLILGQVLKNGGRLPTTGKWAQVREDFENTGGQTGYRDLYMDPEARSQELLNELKVLDRGNVSKAAHAISGWLSDYNEAMENSVRLAAYKAGIDHGMTKERAASLGKILTVNFNRKGRKGRDIGAYYAFFNAAIQGTARMSETLSGPAGKKIIAGGIALGMMNAMLGMAMMGGGGDDSDWNKIPEFIKERSVVIPAPWNDKKYISTPMPLGFNFLPNVGRIAVELIASGGRDAGTQFANLATVLADSFNPMGSAKDPLLMLSPTVIDPVFSLAKNEDWTGMKIYKEDFNSLDPTPGFKRKKDTATPWSTAIAEAINKVSGGTEYAPGAWSPTPDQLDYVIGQVFGGVGREIGKVSQTAGAMISGDELPLYKVPLLGRMYGGVDGKAGQAGKYYENLTKANVIENEIKGRVKDRINPQEFIKKHPDSVGVMNYGNIAEKRINKLRDYRDRLAANNAPKSDLKKIDDQITETMKAFNERMAKYR